MKVFHYLELKVRSAKFVHMMSVQYKFYRNWTLQSIEGNTILESNVFLLKFCNIVV